MPALGPNVWVVRLGARYSIVEERAGAYLVPPVSQRTAIGIARLVARANRSSLIVQRRSGRIRFRECPRHPAPIALASRSSGPAVERSSCPAVQLSA
jgi:hypothetical protein